MLSLAKESDILRILEIKKRAFLYHRDVLKIDQWSDEYPNKEVFLEDISKEELYVYKIDGEIVGFICLNYGPWEEYNELKWSSDEKFLTVHRVAVDTEFKEKGIAYKMLLEIEEIAKSFSCSYLKIDTYSLNDPMNHLIKKLNYNFIGEIKPYLDKESWYCYDKIL